MLNNSNKSKESLLCLMILINSSAKSSSFEKRVVGALNHSVAVVSSAETPSG